MLRQIQISEMKAHMKMASLSICASPKKRRNFQSSLSRQWHILRGSYPWIHVLFKCQEAVIIPNFVHKVRVLRI